MTTLELIDAQIEAIHAMMRNPTRPIYTDITNPVQARNEANVRDSNLRGIATSAILGGGEVREEYRVLTTRRITE